VSILNANKLPVEIQCPHCGNKLKQTIGGLKRNPEVTCPRCRNRTVVTLEGADRVQKDIDAATAGFERTIERLGKRR
jgi:ribosomal protein S27E